MNRAIVYLVISWLMSCNVIALDTYVGCGTVKPAVYCEGCNSGSSGCGCEGGRCVQGTTTCLVASPAFSQCTGGVCFTVYSRSAWCSFRKKCNNSTGQDGGACISTCYQSDELVFEGPRTEYITTSPC